MHALKNPLIQYSYSIQELDAVVNFLDSRCQLKIILLIQDPDAVDCSGNVLLNRFVGAKIILVPPLNYEGSVVDGVRQKGLKHKMIEYMEKLKYVSLKTGVMKK